MCDILRNLFLSICICSIYIFIWSDILDRKCDFKNIKLYFSCIIITLILFYINEFDGIIKIFLLIILFIPLIRMLFNIEYNACLIISFISQFINLLSDILLYLVTKNTNLADVYSVELLKIYILFSCAYLIGSIHLFRKATKFLINKTNNMSSIITMSLIVIMLMTYNFIILKSYYNIDRNVVIIFNYIITIGYAETIYKFLLARRNYLEINNRYLNTIDSLKKYEEMIDKYRILNHENKNQLLTIRGMVLKGEENVPKYIDTIIDTTINDNEKLMFETSVIPSGGLRAIIYSKMLHMMDYSIKFKLDVERNIRKVDLSLLDEEFTLKICKIVGVFLDNAIEEEKNIDNKFIKIRLYLDDDKLCVMISNKIISEFDISKIDEVGYTTKNKGHGYGLSLVKSIIKNEERLDNDRYISDDNFVQILKIQI